tara:strand:+ start:2366 stop:3220 length:855 start_codon:yes stop_codon:yes gene_type:complete
MANTKRKNKKWYQKTGDFLEKYVEPVVEYGKYIPGPQQPFAIIADLAFDAEDVYSEFRKGNYGQSALEGLGMLSNPMAAKGVGTALGKVGLGTPKYVENLAKVPTTWKAGLKRAGGEAVKDVLSGKSAREFRSSDPVSQVADMSTFDDAANAYLTQSMQGASEAAQMMGQSLNRRGLGDSPLGAALQSQALNNAMGRASTELAKMRLNYMQGKEAQLSQEQQQSDQMFYQMMAGFATALARAGASSESVRNWFDGLLGNSSNNSEVNLDYDLSDEDYMDSYFLN